MVEKTTHYNSKMKYVGVFPYSDLYKFCYDWLLEETELDPLIEKEYSEKIKGSTKEVKIKWEGKKEFTDYFRMTIKAEFHILAMTEVEINQGGQKIKANKGDVKLTVKGILERDYDGKFETSAWGKFIRSVYEKWIISTRVKEFEDKVSSKCDEFLTQTKAFLDLAGKR